jgi:hypothetical protein
MPPADGIVGGFAELYPLMPANTGDDLRAAGAAWSSAADLLDRRADTLDAGLAMLEPAWDSAAGRAHADSVRALTARIRATADLARYNHAQLRAAADATDAAVRELAAVAAEADRDAVARRVVSELTEAYANAAARLTAPEAVAGGDRPVPAAGGSTGSTGVPAQAGLAAVGGEMASGLGVLAGAPSPGAVSSGAPSPGIAGGPVASDHVAPDRTVPPTADRKTPDPAAQRRHDSTSYRDTAPVDPGAAGYDTSGVDAEMPDVVTAMPVPPRLSGSGRGRPVARLTVPPRALTPVLPHTVPPAPPALPDVPAADGHHRRAPGDAYVDEHGHRIRIRWAGRRGSS